MNYFKGNNKFTLEPLRQDGKACLECGDVDGIDKVTLTENTILYDANFNESVTRRADDIFGLLDARKHQFPRRFRLGDWQLFDQILRKYLLVTGHRASSLECPTPCCYACPRRVVEYGDEDIEAACPEQEAPPIKVARKDLLFYKFKPSVFIKAACDAVGIDCKPSEPAGCRSSWRTGEFIAPAGDSIPVYISIPGDRHDLDEVVKTLCLLHPDPFVLMAPTRRLLSAESELTLEQRKSLFLAMEEQLIFDEKGNLRALGHGQK